jgi:RNA polymerase sigma-70 factor (ECF subfamily)
MTPPSDLTEWLAAAKEGNAEALNALFAAFRPYVRVLVRSLTGRALRQALDESDLIHDAQLQAARSFSQFRGSSVLEFTAWLRQVVLRTARRALSAEQHRADSLKPEMLQEELASHDPSPEDCAAQRELAVQMAGLIAGLPEDMQQVILERVQDGRTHEEIAGRMGRSSAAIRMLYLRALRQLRERLVEPPGA